MLAKTERKSRKPADDLLDFNDRRLSQTARFAFGAVFIASIAVAFSAFRYGQEAIWLGIALAMLGTLAVAAILPIEELTGADWAASLGEVVRLRRFWILVVVSVSINICWHFLINWTPAYLKDERGLTFQTSTFLSAIPFLAADGGNLGGGWLSRKLASLGISTTRARLLVMSFCTLLILVGNGCQRRARPQRPRSSSFPSWRPEPLPSWPIISPSARKSARGIPAWSWAISVEWATCSWRGFSHSRASSRIAPAASRLIFLLIGLAPLVGLAALLLGLERSGTRRGRAGFTLTQLEPLDCGERACREERPARLNRPPFQETTATNLRPERPCRE